MMGLFRHRVRHRTFLSYHPDDWETVQAFADFFDHGRDVLICHRDGTAQDRILQQSSDTNVMMYRIRERHLTDATVTLVLLSACTWASRLIDWEIMASLREEETGTPNGLLGMVLPTAPRDVRFPLRLQANLGSGYARIYPHTFQIGKLADAIYDAFQARTTRAHLIANTHARQMEDWSCP